MVRLAVWPGRPSLPQKFRYPSTHTSHVLVPTHLRHPNHRTNQRNGRRRCDQCHGAPSAGWRPRGRQSHRLHAVEPDYPFHHPGKWSSDWRPVFDLALSPDPIDPSMIGAGIRVFRFPGRQCNPVPVPAGSASVSRASALTIVPNTGHHRHHLLPAAALPPPPAEPAACHRRGPRRHPAGALGDDEDTGLQSQYVSVAKECVCVMVADPS